MRRSLPARLVVCLALTAALGDAFAAFAADPPTAQYRAFWVDTFNTNLSDHGDVVAVVDNPESGRAHHLLCHVAPPAHPLAPDLRERPCPQRLPFHTASPHRGPP